MNIASGASSITASESRQRGASETGMTPIKTNLEGCCFRRRSDQATLSSRHLNEWSYHNHILQGNYLRFIRHPLLQKEAAAYRLVLVAGKTKGRFTEIMLGPTSEISISKLNSTEAPPNSPYIVNVSGIYTVDSTHQHWQLAFSSVQEQSEWLESLTLAKTFSETLHESLEYDKLKNICVKMLHEIDIRTRVRRFKIHRGVFMGSMAVKWLTTELGVSASQAVVCGNQMLNCNLFHHVAREHTFCDSKLYYRFSQAVFDSKRADESLIATKSDLEIDSRVITAHDLDLLKIEVAELKEKVIELQQTIWIAEFKEIKQNFCILTCFVIAVSAVVNQVTRGAYALAITVICSCVLGVSLLVSLMRTHSKDESVEAADAYLELEDDDEVVGGSSFDGPDYFEEEITSTEFASDYQLMLDEEEGADEEDIEVEELARRGHLASIEKATMSTARRSSVGSRPVPMVTTWPNRPILVRRSPNMLLSSIEETSEEGKLLLAPIKVHDEDFTEIPLESDLFSGKIIMIFKNIENDPRDYFRYKFSYVYLDFELLVFNFSSLCRNRKRKFRALLQGRFNRPIPFSSVYFGQVFEESIRSLPARWLVKTLVQLILKVQPGFRVSMKGDRPYFLVPLFSIAQNIGKLIFIFIRRELLYLDPITYLYLSY
jgi:hypothetical protein